MLGSVTSLRRKVLGPLKKACGPRPKLLTIEVHGNDVKGLALISGKVVSYVLEAQSNQFKVSEMLSVIKKQKP